MLVNQCNYLYVERTADKPFNEGMIYAKMCKTYNEAKSIFDQSVNKEKGRFLQSTPDVPDCFVTSRGLRLEITTNI